MTDTRDPQVAELVTRLVEQAPPAPPFPDVVVSPPAHTRRRIVVATVFFVAVPIVVVWAIVASRHTTSSVLVAPTSTSAPSPTTRPEVSPVLVQPSALAISADGTLYVADVGAHRVVTLSDGATKITRLVTRVDQPRGLAFDHAGNLYIADNGTNTVLRVTRAGVESTYAGDGTLGFAGDGGPASKAKLTSPVALAVGPDDALYIADAGNGRIRRVAPDGTITTFAGNGSPGDTGDGGLAIDAGLDPQALAFDGNGNLDVFHFSGKLIRRIAPDGIITSVESRYVGAFATRPDGSVEIADYGAFGLSLLSTDGTVSPLPFQHAGIFRPGAIAVQANGDAYVADDGASGGGPMRVLRVHPDGTSIDITPRASTATTSTLNPRTAAAAVPYVESLVAQGRLPHAETIQSVGADGDVLVVSTTLTDRTKADELWRAVATMAGCDDSHLLVRGYHVVLADGSVVTTARAGFESCAGT